MKISLNIFLKYTLMEKLGFKYDYNHTKENIFTLYTLEIEVKNQNNLIDSLNSYFES